jgi:hypothetical protein
MKFTSLHLWMQFCALRRLKSEELLGARQAFSIDVAQSMSAGSIERRYDVVLRTATSRDSDDDKVS